MLTALYREIQKWLVGTTTTAKVVTDNKADLDVSNSRSRVSVVHQLATATALIGPGQEVNGGATKRAKVDTGAYTENYLYFYATSASGSPSVTMKVFASSDETLQADDSTLHADWVEVADGPGIEWPSIDHKTYGAQVSATTTVQAAVANRRVRAYKYALQGTGTVNVKFQELVTATNLTGTWNFQAREGAVRDGGDDRWIFQSAVGRGVQVDLSASVATNVELTYDTPFGLPATLTAADEGILKIGRAKGLAVELVNGAASGNTLTFHVRHLGVI